MSEIIFILISENLSLIIHSTPVFRYMFWTDASTSEFPGKIARASMDGSNPVVIATGTGIDEPTSLAIDYEGKYA